MMQTPDATRGSTQSPEQLPREGLLALIRDLREEIQELEQLTNILSRGKYEWESTFDAIQAPVHLIDAEYTVQRANLALANAIGQDITQVIGRKCYEIFADRAAPCEGCPAQAALSKDWPAKETLHHPIRAREYEVHAYPFAGAKGRGHALVMHYRDITEERRLHQELIQQEKMAAIGMLAGGVAHEINNPLGAILAFTQLLIRDCKEGEGIRNDLEEIERAALRCKKIVQDLLDFARASSGREKHPVDIAPLLERTFGFLRRELLSLNVALDTRFDAAVPRILGDPNRLQQVFLNLLTNAIHAMPKGGTLTVVTRAQRKERRVEVTVTDTGIGIAPDHLARVFDPFFTTKGPGHGTGLGLSISYRIVKEHGGTIQAESAVGKGTTFTVVLPTASGRLGTAKEGLR